MARELGTGSRGIYRRRRKHGVPTVGLLVCRKNPKTKKNPWQAETRGRQGSIGYLFTLPLQAMIELAQVMPVNRQIFASPNCARLSGVPFTTQAHDRKRITFETFFFVAVRACPMTPSNKRRQCQLPPGIIRRERVNRPFFQSSSGLRLISDRRKRRSRGHAL